MRGLGRHLSFANVASGLALFVALTTGIAYALENNSVKSKHIAPNQVKGSDVKESTLGGVPSLAAEDLEVDAFELLGEAGSGQVLGRIDDAGAVAGTSFASPLGQSTATGTEAPRLMGTFLEATEAGNLQVQLPSGTMPAGTSRTFTLRSGDNAAGMSDSPLACTIIAEGDDCSTDAQVGFGQLDDVFSIEITTTGAPGVQDFVFGYGLTPQGGVVVP